MTLADVARFATTAARVADAGGRLADGLQTRGLDGYLRAAGVGDVAAIVDALAPGSGAAAVASEAAVRRLAAAAARYADPAELPYRVVGSTPGPAGPAPGAEPWAPLVRHVLGLRSGAVIVVGQTGQGKSTFARHLAGAIADRTGYGVEFCNLHQDDVRPEDTRIGMGRLVMRVARLALTQRPRPEDDADEQDGEIAAEHWHPAMEEAYERYGIESLPALRRTIGRRVIVIDEGSSAFTANAHDSSRWASRLALWHGRHVDWVVILLAQMLSPFPVELLGQCLLFAKQPGGREYAMDRANREVRQFWRAATEQFTAMETSPWRDYIPDLRAWCYADSPAAGAWRGYRGMVPFGLSPPTPRALGVDGAGPARAERGSGEERGADAMA